MGFQAGGLTDLAESENTLFVVPFYRTSGWPVTEHNYSQFLELWGPFASSIGQKYPLSRFNTTGSIEEAVIRAVTHVTTTISYTCQSYKTLSAAFSAGASAFAYRFNKTPSCPWLVADGEPLPNSQDRRIYGAAHTSELPYVFSNLDNLPLGEGSCNASMSERHLSELLVAAWTSMASGGDPSNHRQKWPKFDPCEARGLYIQESLEESTLDYSECQFWQEIWESLGGVKVTPPTCIT